MKTYALIDASTGYVFGVAVANDPVTACRIVDARNGARLRDYLDINNRPFDGGSGYAVHVAPDGFEVGNGRDPVIIAEVSRMPLAANVATRGIPT